MAIRRAATLLQVGRNSGIILPGSLRRQLRIKEGDLLSVAVSEDGKIVLTPVATDPLDRLRKAGMGLFNGVDPVEYQREARDDAGGAP